MNPRPNNPNPEFNPFSYDPESLRNLLVQLQQNPNIQHFQSPSNFQPGFAPFSQPRFESDFVSPSQHDNEVVPETQDTQKRKKGKKNKQPAGTGPSSGPMAPKQWTHDEEIALGRCYMDESENKTKGNSQKRENFWKKVTVSWHNVMGFDAEYRTYHQLNSKWKDMCTKLTKFSGIYSNCANNRKSGMSDENVLKWAEKEYQLKSNGQTFNHYHVWVAIKDSPKFRVLCQEGNEVQGSSKRTKNSESNEYSPGGSTAHTNYAVNLEDDEEEAEFDTPPEPVRPTGRDTTKRASSSSRQTVSSNTSTTELADQLQAFTTFQKLKHEERKKMHEEKTLRSDLRALESLPPDMLDDEDREIMQKMKKKLLDKYR
ncbi:hypothetical protein E3N88_26940 [Mikania micrantha]|uniref:No apical meristem-associated C-terminal domain-containing protein n=1 Tax=Mikania micrantha TaxID=192012 RepID=A0A5N6MVA4_9ASTR|nr:hypothetical protein E3N88_26940 [Mikania micrantha]